MRYTLPVKDVNSSKEILVAGALPIKTPHGQPE